MTRFTMFAIALAIALPAGTGSALAQPEGPWCLKINAGRTATERCHFGSFEACAQERILYGSSAFCGQNPRYLPYWQARGEPVVAPRLKKKKRRAY